jgi:hypothetical protein
MVVGLQLNWPQGGGRCGTSSRCSEGSLQLLPFILMLPAQCRQNRAVCLLCMGLLHARTLAGFGRRVCGCHWVNACLQNIPSKLPYRAYHVCRLMGIWGC